MRNNNRHRSEGAVILRVTCAVAFLLFTFCWLYFFQGDMLAVAQHGLSGGKTHYDHTIGAIICTAVLFGLQLLVFFLTRLTRRTHALTYFPSMLLLAFVIVIAVRLTILLILSGGIDRENIVASIIVDYVFSLGALIFLAENAMRINARALEDREKARLAQYRYMNLSQQVNPHFLFNSLNILDCLVCEEKTDQASTYIHKLAAIYRYLLRNEEERLVKLRDEMDFVDQYVDLLKVRFPEGLDIQIDIPADRLNRRVVPCSVQLLIENATKHNAVSADKPLQIMVKCEDDCVVVSNTLNPKISSGPSTGLGLKYLREQYQDVAGNTPVVRMGENEYTVVIPLI